MSNLHHRTLSTQAEISAYLHQTRMRIVNALSTGPATVTQIAAILDVHPANLTRHIRTLLEAGLIELAYTKDIGRNLEKYYQTTARSFDVAPEMDTLESPHKIALAFARSDLSAAISQLPDQETRPILSYLASARIPIESVQEFHKAFEELIANFDNQDDETGQRYHLAINLYPSDAPEVNEQEIQLQKQRGDR